MYELRGLPPYHDEFKSFLKNHSSFVLSLISCLWFRIFVVHMYLILAPMNYFEPNFLALSLIATNWRWTYKSWTTAQGSEKKDLEKKKKQIQAQLLTLAQCDGVVRRVEIASELSIKVIFPKSGWQVWLNTLVVWSSSTIRTK